MQYRAIRDRRAHEENPAVRGQLLRLRDRLRQAAGAVVGIGDHRVPAGTCRRHDAVGEIGHERLAEIGDGQSDELRAAGFHGAGGHVNAVSEAFDGILDTLARLRAHTAGVVQHIRHRFDRYAGRLRDLAHGHHVLAVGAILLRHVNPFSPKRLIHSAPTPAFAPCSAEANEISLYCRKPRFSSLYQHSPD